MSMRVVTLSAISRHNCQKCTSLWQPNSKQQCHNKVIVRCLKQFGIYSLTTLYQNAHQNSNSLTMKNSIVFLLHNTTPPTTKAEMASIYSKNVNRETAISKIVILFGHYR